MMREHENWVDRKWNFDLPPQRFDNVVERFRGTPARAAELVAGVSAASLTARVGKSWSAQEHVAHLDDLHDLDEKRLAEFIDGADVLSAADMGNAITEAARHNEARMSEILERFRRRRESLVAKLDALPADAIVATSWHARLGQALRLIDWVYFLAEHDDHHLVRARRTLGLVRNGRA